MITKITQTAKKNVRFLDANDNVLHQLSRNKQVYLDVLNTDRVYISEKINEHDTAPSNIIVLDVNQITQLGGVSFSGTAQDLIASLDAYFFG